MSLNRVLQNTCLTNKYNCIVSCHDSHESAKGLFKYIIVSKRDHIRCSYHAFILKLPLLGIKYWPHGDQISGGYDHEIFEQPLMGLGLFKYNMINKREHIRCSMGTKYWPHGDQVSGGYDHEILEQPLI